jgi:hypothetical protein
LPGRQAIVSLGQRRASAAREPSAGATTGPTVRLFMPAPHPLRRPAYDHEHRVARGTDRWHGWPARGRRLHRSPVSLPGRCAGPGWPVPRRTHCHVRPGLLSRCRSSISRSCTTAAIMTALEGSTGKTTGWRGRPTVRSVTPSLPSLAASSDSRRSISRRLSRRTSLALMYRPERTSSPMKGFLMPGAYDIARRHGSDLKLSRLRAWHSMPMNSSRGRGPFGGCSGQRVQGALEGPGALAPLNRRSPVACDASMRPSL